MHKPWTFRSSCPPPFPCAHYEAAVSTGSYLYSSPAVGFPSYPLGNRFCSLHKSKNTIKATHQRAIKGTNNSALLWRGCHCTERFLQKPFLTVTTNAEEQLLVPLQTIRSSASPAGRNWTHPKERRICTQSMPSQWPGLVSSSVSLSSNLILLHPMSVFLDEKREHWLMRPH